MERDKTCGSHKACELTVCFELEKILLMRYTFIYILFFCKFISVLTEKTAHFTLTFVIQQISERFFRFTQITTMTVLSVVKDTHVC